jgi:PII-like signaling protein
MHQLFAAFFAMLFSFGHAQTLHTSEVALASQQQPYVQAAVPTRQEVARKQFETVTSYAEDSCVSCRRMNVDYDAR